MTRAVRVPSSAIESDANRGSGNMKSMRAHTRQIINDDIDWLESRIQRLESADRANERRRAECYRELLLQRQRQLAAADGACPGCWPDYFG